MCANCIDLLCTFDIGDQYPFKRQEGKKYMHLRTAIHASDIPLKITYILRIDSYYYCSPNHNVQQQPKNLSHTKLSRAFIIKTLHIQEIVFEGLSCYLHGPPVTCNLLSAQTWLFLKANRLCVTLTSSKVSNLIHSFGYPFLAFWSTTTRNTKAGQRYIIVKAR
jgi:hypothetical protein